MFETEINIPRPKSFKPQIIPEYRLLDSMLSINFYENAL